ncbi:MAG: CsiV family protein [Thiomicrorhabdus sp.]|nr:CsiV family protein [Thiomicrorhabdus sp.]
MRKAPNYIQSLFIRLPLITLFSLTFFANGTVQAKAESYAIEVIVFESLALRGWTEEYWPEDFERPSIEGSSSVFSRGQKPLFIKNYANTLDGAVAKLNKRGYRVLFHQAWSQQAYANKNSPTVLIENKQGVGTNMLGTVRLYKTRYAHVDFDLEFEKYIPSKILEAFMQNQKISATQTPNSWRFHLKESRKIKPGELHYIDHPLFGVLVKIQPLEN